MSRDRGRGRAWHSYDIPIIPNSCPEESAATTTPEEPVFGTAQIGRACVRACVRAIRTKTPVDSAPLPHASPRLEITRDDHTCSSWTTSTIRSVPHTRAASAFVAMAARRTEAEAAATVSGRLIKDSACLLARPFRREFDDKPVRRYRTLPDARVSRRAATSLRSRWSCHAASRRCQPV
jgi:hypothetical protein